jgi:HSP90 family molecular chaperone
VSTISDEHFRGEITVAARIIDLLSSGLYESPAACLKELINNSFDADARSVDVFVKPDANRIIIQDDGHGMNREEFERHFRRIAESHKRDDDDTTASGRPKIGKIGIGVIAANELCERLEIFSTKADSSDLLHVTIDFEEMRKPADQRKKASGDFVKADYVGEILRTDVEAHYTLIFPRKDGQG